MPLKPGSDQATISSNIHELTHHGSRPRSHAQIVAIALSNADKHPHRALGGGAFGLSVTHADPLGKLATPHPPHIAAAVPKIGGIGGSSSSGGSHQISPSQGSPWWSRSEARTDDRPMSGGMGIGGGHSHLDIGGMSSSTGSPWWERSQARIMDVPFNGGLIGGSGGGRTDQIPMSVPGGSHVLTADAVSGAGQGNTAAGARNILQALKIGPWGVPDPEKVRGHGPPHAPPMAKTEIEPAGESHGGTTGHPKRRTSVLVASGEMVVPADDWLHEDEVSHETNLYRGVRSIGRDWYKAGGETATDAEYESKGHDILDRAMKNIRDFNMKWLKSAPKPKK